MATLEEYVGGLFNSISDARVAADLHTVAMAEEYSRHDLLQHFAVPRMRIRDVKITMPVALEKSPEQETHRQLGPIGTKAFNQGVRQHVIESLGRKTLPKRAEATFEENLASSTDDLKRNYLTMGKTEAISVFSDRVSENVKHLHKTRKLTPLKQVKIDYKKISSRIAEYAHSQISNVDARKEIGKLQVTPEAHRLREHRPEDLMRIEITINEDSMEWHIAEDENGNAQRKLIPE